MRVVLSAPPKYHFFDLGRQLAQRGILTALMTGYPLFKLKDETELAPYFRTFPHFHVFYRAMLSKFKWDLEYRDKVIFDSLVKRNLPECDIFMGIAASFLESAKVARSKGAGVIVDRPCSHIEAQNDYLQSESMREKIPLRAIDPRVIQREMEEYQFADLITVPSNFAAKSFYDRGFTKDKIRVIPYGIDLSVFHPVGEPDPERFDVLFAGQLSLRKGVVHLLRAFERLQHPKKRLILVGSDSSELGKVVAEYASRLPIEVLGHIPQSTLKNYMSRSHVFVLPSIEDGYGLVMIQSMACGAPVIASANTGADMLITDGQEGFVVPAGDDDALTQRLQQIADDPDLRQRMSTASLERVARLDGWSVYCDAVVGMFEELRGQK